MYVHAPIPLPKQLDVWSHNCASGPVVLPDPDFTLFLPSFNTLGWERQVPLVSKISCTRCQLATGLHQVAPLMLLQHEDWHTPSLHPSTFTVRKRYNFLLLSSKPKLPKGLYKAYVLWQANVRMTIGWPWTKFRARDHYRHQVAVHEKGWLATGELLTHFWPPGHSSWTNVLQDPRPV